jgi:ribosomal protein L11 methyltransferase
MRIALSGILDAQADEVARAYAPWFDIGIGGGDEGWTLLLGTRK